jgi:2-polyprenyl-3-methyl-5-hydroxy-6-metoxy-1,4-benzoquinol methylase
LLQEIYPDNYYSNVGPNLNESYLLSFLQKTKKKIEHRFFSKILKKIKKNNISCLDIGGGSGWILNNLREIDPRISKTTVLDINQDAKKLAEAHGHQFIHSTVEEFSKNEQFDLVLMLNLIEHVKDPEKVLASIKDSMTEDGLLLIKTPNTHSLNSQIFKRLYWGGYHAPRHWVLFNKNNLYNLAHKVGFEVTYFSYTQGGHQWAASLLGSIKHLTFNNQMSPPMHKGLSMALLILIFVVFDYLRAPFFRTDQMFFLLKKSIPNRLEYTK